MRMAGHKKKNGRILVLSKVALIPIRVLSLFPSLATAVSSCTAQHTSMPS